jgi:hypothetical protein
MIPDTTRPAAAGMPGGPERDADASTVDHPSIGGALGAVNAATYIPAAPGYALIRRVLDADTLEEEYQRRFQVRGCHVLSGLGEPIIAWRVDRWVAGRDRVTPITLRGEPPRKGSEAAGILLPDGRVYAGRDGTYPNAAAFLAEAYQRATELEADDGPTDR